MKIAILTERMRIGFGVDLVVDEQATRLAAAGHDVSVVVIHADFSQPPRPYKLIVINRLIHGADYSSHDAMRKILAMIGLEDVDLWMLHTPPFYDWLPWLDGPVVITEYGTPPGHFFKPDIGGQLDTMVHRRLHDLYGNLQPFDAIVSISHSLHEWLPPQAQRHSSVIHLGIDHFAQAAPDNAQALRQDMGVGADECLILWVGRMQLAGDEQPYKGFPELLALAPLIERHAPNTKFMLAGRISDTDQRSLERNGFAVLPNLSAAQMGNVYAAADILLNLSQWEGFNLAPLEAQYQGTPAIAYDFGPHREIIQSGTTGLLVETPRQLVEAVLHLAGDRELRARLSANAAAFAGTFTWSRNAAELLSVAEQCVSRAPPRGKIVAMREETSKQNAAVAARQAIAASQPKLTQAQRNAHAPVRRAATRLGLRGGVQDSGWLAIQADLFVKEAYLALLGRAAEPAAVEGRVAQLAAGQSRADLLAEIRFSPEGMTRAVVDPELQHLIDQAIAGASPSSTPRAGDGRIERRPKGSMPVSDWFLASDIMFIQRAYVALLGRHCSPDEQPQWLARLGEGDSRPSVLATIRNSAEGRGRPVTDPELRRILAAYAASNHGAGPASAGAAADGAREPEDVARQVRRLESRQRQLMEQVTGLGQTLASIEQGLLRREPAQAGPDGGVILASATVDPATLDLGPEHVLLIVPGATILRDAAERLAQTVLTEGSDIVYGDERIVSPGGSTRTRTNGPWSRLRLLQGQKLGGAIVVHRAVLDKAGLAPSVILTDEIAVRLATLAHSIAYLPIAICERSAEDATATGADLRAVTGHEARIEDLVPAADARGGSGPRGVAIVVAADGSGMESLDDWIARIRATSPDGIHVTIAIEDDSISGDSLPAGVEIMRFAPDTSLGAKVNRAARAAPADCDLVVAMQQNVLPTSADWLERLARTARHDDTGLVAPAILYRDGRVRHAGLRLDPHGTLTYIGRGRTRDEAIAARHIGMLAEVPAISGECFMIRRRVLEEQGGMSEQFGADAASFDLCIRLRTAGLAVLLDGGVEMMSAGDEGSPLRALHLSPIEFLLLNDQSPALVPMAR